ncbi:MAG: hypothetical protein ACJAVK_003220 [Akkermansiaceae bacterium]
MKTSKTPLSYTGLLVFAAAAIVGWKTSTSTAPVSASVATESLSTRHARSTSPGLMGNVRSQRTEGDRMRTAIEMARTLPSSEIKEWLDQGTFNLRRGYAMTLFQKIAFERWAGEEPSEFLVWASSNSSSSYKHFIADIVKNEPGAIQSALASLDSNQKKEVLIQLIAGEAPDLALAELRKLLSSSHSANHNFYNAFSALAKHRPAELERMLADVKGPARDSLEQIVISAKLEKDFEGTLAQLYEMPNGFEYLFGRYSHNNNRNLKPGELLSHLANFPESWRAQAVRNSSRLFKGIESVEQFSEVDWAGMGFTAAQTGKLQASYFQRKVQNKPEETLAAIANFEFSENAKRNIFRAAFYSTRTEEDLAKYRDNFTNPEDRALFDEVAEDKASSINNMAQTSKIETPAQLVSTLTDRNVANLSSVIRNWDVGQKEELISTYHELEGTDKDYLASLAIKQNSGIPADLRSEALKHLLTLPESSEFSDWKGGQDDGIAVEAVSQNALDLMQFDPAKATTWLAELPEGPIRLQARKNLAVNWRNYEPEAVKKWLSSLPASEQTEINRFLKSK